MSSMGKYLALISGTRIRPVWFIMGEKEFVIILIPSEHSLAKRSSEHYLK